MVNAIFKGLFWLITTIFSIVLAPVIGTITVLFPNLTTATTNVTLFLTRAVVYVRSILHLLLIPDSLMVLYWTFFLALNTMFFIGITVYFIVNIYNKFKL